MPFETVDHGIPLHGPCVSFNLVGSSKSDTHGAASSSGLPPVAPCPLIVSASSPPVLSTSFLVILLVVRPRLVATSQGGRLPPPPGREGSVVPGIVTRAAMGWLPCCGMASGRVAARGFPPGWSRWAACHRKQRMASPVTQEGVPGTPTPRGAGAKGNDNGTSRDPASASLVDPPTVSRGSDLRPSRRQIPQSSTHVLLLRSGSASSGSMSSVPHRCVPYCSGAHGNSGGALRGLMMIRRGIWPQGRVARAADGLPSARMPPPGAGQGECGPGTWGRCHRSGIPEHDDKQANGPEPPGRAASDAGAATRPGRGGDACSPRPRVPQARA